MSILALPARGITTPPPWLDVIARFFMLGSDNQAAFLCG
jgi:hypothetical protein